MKKLGHPVMSKLRRRRPLAVALPLLVVIASTVTCSLSIPAGASTVYTIEGTVTDAQGNPQAGICVTATPVGVTGASSGNVTASDGTYKVGGGFGTGNYNVYFSAGASCTGAGNYAFQYYDNARTAALATPVAVTAGETTTGVDVVLEPGGIIEGTVKDASTGSDLQGICIQARLPGSTTYWTASTGPDGTYAINGLNTGDYNIEFFSQSKTFCSAPGAAYVPQWYSDEASQGTADPVSVTAGEVTTAIDISLVPSGLPGPPTLVTPTPSDGSASVVFTAPNSDGGNSITSYTATALDLTDPLDGGRPRRERVVPFWFRA